MTDPRRLRALAEDARRRAPVADDPQMSGLRGAQVGGPVAVYDPDGAEAFWLVPFVESGRACGYALVDRSDRVTAMSVLGSPLAAAWFEQPPAAAVAEIRAAFPGAQLSSSSLSYDGVPARWAWRIVVTEPTGRARTVFLGPGGWYEQRSRPPGARPPASDREG